MVIISTIRGAMGLFHFEILCPKYIYVAHIWDGRFMGRFLDVVLVGYVLHIQYLPVGVIAVSTTPFHTPFLISTDVIWALQSQR